MTELERLSKIIEEGQVDLVRPALKRLLQAGIPAEVIVRDGLMPGMERVGQAFEHQRIFIPEMLRAARAARLGTEELRACFRAQHGASEKKKMIIGTVQGDLHDIGKNLVSIAMQTVVEVIDLGVDVPVDQFVAAAEMDENVIFVGVSALLTTTLPQMRRTVEALRRCKAAERIKIFVGGAPVSPDFARKIGADAYTISAFAAAERAREFLMEAESKATPQNVTILEGGEWSLQH